MARPSEITSTEKLLRVIRKKKHGTPVVSDRIEAPSKKTGRFRFSSPAIMALHKPSTVGIDIGHDYIRLVRVIEKGRGNWQILDRRRLAIPQDIPVNTPEFAAFLKSALISVCGSPRRSHLWVIMSAARVEVHHITIPKVAKKQLGNVVYWTIKKESPFNEKEMSLDFEIQGEVIEQGTPKLAAMVYITPRQEIEDLKNLFTRIGWPLTGISIASFSVQNLLRTEWIPSFDMTVANLYIGIDFSRIDIYSKGNLVMTRGIRAGLNSMTDAVVERFSETKPNSDTMTLTNEQGNKIVQSLSPDSPPLRKADIGFDLGKKAIFEMIEPALERLARQVERTFEHYNKEKPDDRIGRIFLSGAMNYSQPVVDYMGTQLGIASSILDPLIDEESSACPDVDDQRCASERVAFGLALGLALSDNERTPNLMFSYKDKEQEVSVKRINRAVLAVFLCSVLICSVVFMYQNHIIKKMKLTIAGIQGQLAQAGVPVDRNQLLRLAAAVKQKNELSKGYADRYLGMVLISELASQTPAQIRLTDLKITLRPASMGDTAKKEAPKARVEEIVVEGVILGEKQMLETSLAAYTMALEASPLFKQVSIQKTNLEPYLKGEALHFILNLSVEEQVHG